MHIVEAFMSLKQVRLGVHVAESSECVCMGGFHRGPQVGACMGGACGTERSRVGGFH